MTPTSAERIPTPSERLRRAWAMFNAARISGRMAEVVQAHERMDEVITEVSEALAQRAAEDEQQMPPKPSGGVATAVSDQAEQPRVAGFGSAGTTAAAMASSTLAPPPPAAGGDERAQYVEGIARWIAQQVEAGINSAMYEHRRELDTAKGECIRLHNKLNEARAELEQARAARSDAGDALDARRYRWLREQSHPWGPGYWYSLGTLDAAIDAALASPRAGGE